MIVLSVDHRQISASEQRDTSNLNRHQTRFDHGLSRGRVAKISAELMKMLIIIGQNCLSLTFLRGQSEIPLL